MSTDVGGRPTLSTYQVTATSAAQLLVAGRQGRASITLVNEGTNPVRYGDARLLTVTGALLPGILGASVTLAYCGDLWISAAAGATVSVTEVYG